LVSAGLLSSTFHLGHPERAWRAVIQWRSSWLSREGVMAILTYIPIAALAWAWIWLEDVSGPWVWAGPVTAVMALVTVYCTGMIYASLKAIPRWSNPWVPVTYIALALATGAVAMDALMRLFGVGSLLGGGTAVVSLVLASICKLAYWRNIDNASPVATAESATGLGSLGTVRPLDPPHTEANYLQKEMGYRVARKHAAKLRQIAILLLFAVPIVLSAIAGVAGDAIGLAAALLGVLSVAAGVLVERWLFFAEAVHVVTLYYGTREA